VSLHGGLGQPSNPFYQQLASRPAPLNQFGAATVAVLDRQRWVFSLRGEQLVRFGGPAGLKFVAYGEIHAVPSAQRETSQPEVYEPVPSDNGFVIGGQVGGFLGDRGSFLNLFVRYAGGIAAYGEFGTPSGLALDRTASGAHELVVATSGNWEVGPLAFTLGGYFRSFRNANDQLDFEDLDEGIVMLRPHLFYIDWAGVALEGSYQIQQRGVLVGELSDPGTTLSPEPLVAQVGRIGVVPFLAPAGPGAYSRPWFYFAYVATFRDQEARMLYPEGDVFRIREIDHYAGIGAEWWFGSTSYGGP
jgi:maltoporin